MKTFTYEAVTTLIHEQFACAANVFITPLESAHCNLQSDSDVTAVIFSSHTFMEFKEVSRKALLLLKVPLSECLSFTDNQY